MEASFHRLFPLKACRHTHLRAEHFKQWLREAYPGENSNTPPRIERRMILVDIVQNMWKTGEIARVRAGAQPFLDRYREGQGVLPEPVSVGGPTHT